MSSEAHKVHGAEKAVEEDEDFEPKIIVFCCN